MKKPKKKHNKETDSKKLVQQLQEQKEVLKKLLVEIKKNNLSAL